MEDVLRTSVHQDIVQPQWTGGGGFRDYMLPMPLTWLNHAGPEAVNGRRVTSKFTFPPYPLFFPFFFPLAVFFAFANFPLWYWPFWSRLMWFGFLVCFPLVCFALVFFSSI